MIVRHYARGTHKRLTRNPDEELNAYLAARENKPSDTPLRGIPAITTHDVRVSERWKGSHHKRQPVYDGNGYMLAIASKRRRPRNITTVVVNDAATNYQNMLSHFGAIGNVE